MKDIYKQIKRKHSVLQKTRKIGNEIERGFLIKDILLTVFIELTGFINSVYLIKYVLDHLKTGYRFRECIPIFAVIIVINLISMIFETVRDNINRNRHVLLLAKKLSSDFYLKMSNINYKEHFNYQAKNAVQFAYYNTALVVYNSEIMVSTYLGYAVAFLINLAAVIYYGGWGGLLILVSFFAVMAWIQKIAVKVNDIDLKHMLVQNDLNRRFNYFKNNIFLNKQTNQVLKVENAFRFFFNKYRDILEEQREDNINRNKEVFWYNAIRNHLFSFAYQVVYFVSFTYRLIISRNLTIGAFWACYKACLNMFGNNVINYYSVMHQAVQWIEQVKYFFDISDESGETGDLAVDHTKDFEIRFEHVSFSYPGQKQMALKDINLVIKKGMSVVILGDNGAGKSTIILLLYRLFTPTGGSITLNGIDIGKYDLKQYRSMINIMFQDFKLYPYSIGNNVSLENDYEGMRANIKSRIKEVGLEKVVNCLDKDIDTNLTRLFDASGYVPSGGETSKLGFAQQLMHQNGIFVFDEYDADIDPISEQELNKKLLQMGQTKIIISHRFSIAKEADMIYWIEKGKTVESGTHNALCELSGRYAEMYFKRKNLFCAKEEN